MWEAGKYSIKTRESGREVVDGIIHTEFGLGIHINYNNRMSITHVASGLRLHGCFSPKYFGDAMTFVEKVGPLADWQDQKPEIKYSNIYDQHKNNLLPPEAILGKHNAIK